MVPSLTFPSACASGMATENDTATAGRPMIELVEVTKTFDRQVVLNKLNLKIPAGKITAVIGPSGEGKSVLLKHMIGLMRPDSGTVLVEGENITAMGRNALNKVREKFGMLFQNAALFDSMTVFENVAFPWRKRPGCQRPRSETRCTRPSNMWGLREWMQSFPMNSRGG